MAQYLKPQVPLEQGTNYVYPLTTIDQVIGSDGTTRLNNELNGIRDDVATIETSSTSAHSYAVGQYLVYGNQLYKVTTAIASGDTLSVGTNIQSTTVGNELKSLNDSLDTLDAYSSDTVVSAATSSGTLEYNSVFRRGNVVTASARQYGTGNVTTAAALFRIPEGFRPSGIRRCIGYSYIVEDSVIATSMWTINTDGTVVISYSEVKHTNNFGFAATYII